MKQDLSQFKLSEKHRLEVNTLIEEAQDDLENVLFKLVWQREQLRGLGNDLCDSCSHIGWTCVEQPATITKAEKRMKAWNDFCAQSEKNSQ